MSFIIIRFNTVKVTSQDKTQIFMTQPGFELRYEMERLTFNQPIRRRISTISWIDSFESRSLYLDGSILMFQDYRA